MANDLEKALFNSYYFLIAALKSNETFIHERKIINIVSSPRGGSTWITEIINFLQPSIEINEPLTRGNITEFSKIGLEHDQHVPDYFQWEELYNVFKDLYSCKILNLSLLGRRQVFKVLHINKIIIKYVNVHLLLPWLLNHFSFKTIFLIRHPCAVINSQLNNKTGWLEAKANPKYQYRNINFNDVYLKHSNVLDKISRTEENLAATWAIMNNYLLSHPYHGKKWFTVYYENLISNPEIEIQKICEYLEIAYDKKVLEKVKMPSRSANTDLFEINIDQLSKWQNELTEEQIKNVLNIVSEIGIGTYNESIMPNLSTY